MCSVTRKCAILILTEFSIGSIVLSITVKPGNKEQFNKEQIGIKEPYPVTNLPFTS